MATMMETYSYNVQRNAAALQRLRTEFNVQVHDTPKDIFPAFIKATNEVYDREAGKNPFFKEVLDSQRAFVVPSSHRGRANTRFAILNPLTTFDDLVGILDTMK